MKPNIYAGELNDLRIAAYQKLAESYNLTEGTVGRIFCAGADWAVDTIDKLSQQNKSECFPNECDHPVNRRTYYDGGSSWCTKCWSYVDLPPHKEDCKHLDPAQGRNKCLLPVAQPWFFPSKKCTEICKHFEKK